MKFKVKKKIIANKAKRNATGDGRLYPFILSPLERRVANLLQLQKQLNPESVRQDDECQLYDDEYAVTDVERTKPNATDDRISKQLILSPLKKRVANLLHLHEQLDLQDEDQKVTCDILDDEYVIPDVECVLEDKVP